MLSESSEGEDPAQFKETELYKKCVEMGVVPASEFDLAQKAGSKDPPAETPSAIPENTQDNILNLSLIINGMWCPACSWLVDETLKKMPGIEASTCNFSTDRLNCQYDPVRISPSKIISKINSLGYRANLPDESDQKNENRREFIRFCVSAFLTMNVMMLSFALYAGFFSELSKNAVSSISWPILVMSALVLIYGGKNIFKKALIGVIHASPGMETLISMGALSAFVYSCYNFCLQSIHLYFDTAAMLITLVLLGKMLERRAKDRVLADLEKFFSLMPGKVKICTPKFPDGRYVSVDQLKRHDLFQVAEGEVVPADGLVMQGTGTVDESSLTGEAQPISKRPGLGIKSGTRITDGMFRIRAEYVGDSSVLGQMIQIMQQSLDQKTPIEGKTDLILKWFVPLMFALAAGTGVAAFLFGLSADSAMLRAITVLVISCPCALGIAIPMARVAGVSLSGKNGILVRNFSAFSQAEKIDVFVFDKTGTLTQGNWSLMEVRPIAPYTESQALAMAAALESKSDHYIGLEISRQAKEKELDLPKINDIRFLDNGVTGQMLGKRVKIGSESFLSPDNASLPLPVPIEDSKRETARSFVSLSCEDKPVAVLIFGDRIRKTAFTLMEHLKNLNKHVVMVSGDGEKTTQDVGRLLGITEFHGSKLPAEKAEIIKDLQHQGFTVAMAGDGVNDALALATSDVSFAVHSGTHPGKEAADITLMQGDPAQVLTFMCLGKRVNRKIAQNLWLSFIYNGIGIPVAMAGLLTPLIAVLAMLMSSLTVIGNTLLLIKKDS